MTLTTIKQFKKSLVAASLIAIIYSPLSSAQELKGQIVNDQGNAVAGALIQIKGSKLQQKSDANGNFSFLNLSPEQVELHISAAKYAHKYQDVTVESTDNSGLVITLSSTVMEVLDVYATPLHSSSIESAIPVNVISGEALKLKQASTLGGTLKNEVGIHETYYGSVASSPIVRGLDGPRVMITQNGLDAGDASRVGADHSVATETSMATQVEVLRGPATLFYGSGAIGGVVNIVDNRVPKSTDTEVEWLLQYNDVSNEEQGALSLQTGVNNIAVHLDGFVRDGGNYQLPKDFVNDAEHNPEHNEKLENSDSTSSGFNLGTSYILDQGYIGFSYGVLTKDYGIPGHFHHEDEHDHDHEHDHQAALAQDPSHTAIHEEERTAAAMKQSRYQLLSEINFNDSFIEQLTTKIAYTDYQHQEIENGHIGTTFSNDSVEAKIDLTHQDVIGWHGAWTLHYKMSDFEATGDEAFTPPSKTTTIAAAWLEEKHFGKVLLQLGARVEQVNISVDDSYIGFHEPKDLISYDTEKFNPLSASMGLVYDYQKGYNIGLATSFSQRAPSAAELFSFGPHIGSQTFEIGAMYIVKEEHSPAGEELHVELSSIEPALETSRSIDLTWRKFEGDFGFVISAFYNQIDDFYYQQDTGHHFEDDHDASLPDHADHDEHEEGLPILVYQQSDVDMFGLEAEFAYQLTESFKTKLFGDVVKTKLVGGGNNDSLPRIPPMRLGASLAYQGNNFDTEFSVNHYFAQNDISPLETVTPSYTMVDMTFNYFISEGVYNAVGLNDIDSDIVLYFKGQNLTDEYAKVHSSFLKDTAPLPGRNFSIGIRGSF